MAKKTPAEQQEIHDKFTDWEKSDQYPQMQYSKSGSLFWCPDHKFALEAKHAANHNKSCMRDLKKSGQSTSKILNEIIDSENQNDFDQRVTTPEQMVLEDHNKEIAEAASMLAKDYELRAEFEMLHALKTIPWDWSFYDWLKLGCVDLWNKTFSYELTLNHDISKISPEARGWEKQTIIENIEHDAEGIEEQ